MTVPDSTDVWAGDRSGRGRALATVLDNTNSDMCGWGIDKGSDYRDIISAHVTHEIMLQQKIYKRKKVRSQKHQISPNETVSSRGFSHFLVHLSRRRRPSSVVRPSLNFHIFDFYSETTEQNSTKLDRKQKLNILYQICVFRADRKKQDGRPGH